MKPFRPSFALPLLALCALSPLTARADADYDFASGLYQKKLYGLAATNLKEFLAAKPNDPNAKIASYQLGAALYRAGGEKDPDFAAVAKAYEAAIARFPDPQLEATARFELGDAYFNLKQYDKSLAAYAAFLKSNPKADQAAQALYWSGENLTALKKPAEARAMYQKVVTSYGTSDIAPFAQYGLAVSFADAGESATAATAFGVVVAKYPASEVAAESRLRLGDALLAQKKYPEARAAYAAIVTSADKSAAPWKNDAEQGIADADFGLKKWPEAAKEYGQILASLGENDTRRNALQSRLADSFFNAKDWNKAVEAYEPLLKTTGNTRATALYYSAGALRSAGKFDESATRYRQITEEFPTNALAPKAALRLGDALADAKKTTAAASAYKTVLTKYAGTDSAKEAQAALLDLATEAGNSKTGDTGLEDVLKSLPAGPASSNAQLRLAQVAYKQEDWKRAASLAAAALASKPDKQTAENASYLLASSKLNAGDAAGAATAFTNQVQKFPAGTLAGQARLGLAWALLDAKKYKEAQNAARPALVATTKLAPEIRTQLRLALGEALWRGGAATAKEAVKVLAPIESNASPAFASQAALNSALALDSLKDAGAAAKWAKYATLTPDNAEKARGYLRQGLALVQAKNAKSAIGAFDRAAAAEPKGTLAARAVYEGAWAAHDAKSPDEAARWAKLLADYPESSYAAEAAFQNGETLFAAGKWSDAAVAYRAVAEKYPTAESAPAAWYQLGASLYKAEQWSEAATAFDRAAGFAKSDNATESLFWSGESLRRAAQPAEARVRYAKFVAAPKASSKLLPAARLGLGQSFAAAKEWTSAISTYESGLKDANGIVAAELEFRLGEALVEAGREKDATPHFLKVTISYPNSPWAAQAQWNAAAALEKGGNKTGALELYRALAALTPATDLTKQAEAKVQELGG